MSKPYSFRFPDTDAGREAEKILTYCMENFADPQDSQESMKTHHVVIEALFLLGKQLNLTGKLPSASLDLSQLEAIITERLSETEAALNRKFAELLARLESLSVSGQITEPAKQEIKAALGISDEFARNAASAFTVKKKTGRPDVS